jgi:hypothetical protein
VTNKVRLLYNRLTVASYLQREKEMQVEPEDIEYIEEWAQLLLVTIKGRRATLVSKKKLQESVSLVGHQGGTFIQLAPAVVVLIYKDQNTLITLVGYNDPKEAWRMRDWLVNQRLARSGYVRPACFVANCYSEMLVRGMDAELVLKLSR